MFELILISLNLIYTLVILYIFYKINKISKKFNFIKFRLFNIESYNKKIPKNKLVLEVEELKMSILQIIIIFIIINW